MDFAEYVRSISFRLLQPGTPRPSGFRALNQLARRAGLQLEMWMTALPEGQERMQKRLRRVCRGPRTSTFAIGAIINRGVAELPAGQTYLNLGVGCGFPLFAGMAGNRDKRCIGVDAFCHKHVRRDVILQRFERWRRLPHSFHEMDPREYLRTVHQEPIGFCTYDGPHSYQVLTETLQLAEPFFTENCRILIDDANWPEVRRAALEFVARSEFRYRVLLDVRTPRTGHPTFWNGILLLARGRKKVESATLPMPERKAA